MMQEFFDIIFRMSVEGIVIFTIIFALCFLLKKLHISHKYIVVLWLILFFYLVFPWKLEMPVGFWNYDAVQNRENADVVSNESVESDMGYVPIVPEGMSDFVSIQGSEHEGFYLDSDTEIMPEQSMHQTKSTLLSVVKSAIPYAWVLISIALFGHFIYSYAVIRKKLAVCVHDCDNVYLAQDIHTPMVFGLLNPKIYLPLHLEETELLYVLAHEKMHVRRRDYIIKVLAYMICMLHWFNPFVWMAYHLLGSDIEKACDEEVIRSLGEDRKKEYANALLSAAAGKLNKREKFFVAPICFDEGNVKSRIKNIVKYKYTLPIVGAVVLVIMVVLGVVFMTKGKAESSNNEENIVVENESIDAITEENSDEAEDMDIISGDPYYIESEAMVRVGFQDLLGYDGYFITRKDSTPMETTYYAVEGDETFIIAQSWNFEREDNFIDIDGDGIRELVCNVVSGDGGQNTLIYRRFEDGIRVAYASQLLDKEYDDLGVYSLVTWYDVAFDRIEIAYWLEELQDYEYAYYDLDIEGLSWYKPDIPNNGTYTLKSIIFYEDDIMVEAAAIGKKIGGYDLYGVKEIDIYINDSLSQTLIMQEAIEKDGIPMIEEGFTRCSEFIADECLIKTVDINFDGYLDLQVYAWDTKDDSYYYYYCWNPQKSCFEYAFCLNKPEIDIENQLLITYNLVSRYEMYHYNYYKVGEDNTLELIKTVEAPVVDTGY